MVKRFSVIAMVARRPRASRTAYGIRERGTCPPPASAARPCVQPLRPFSRLRHLALVASAFALVSALWLAPPVSAGRALRQAPIQVPPELCPNPPCFAVPATPAAATTTASLAFDIPPPVAAPVGPRPYLPTGTGPVYLTSGSGPTAVLPSGSGPTAVLSVEQPAPAVQQPLPQPLPQPIYQQPQPLPQPLPQPVYQQPLPQQVAVLPAQVVQPFVPTMIGSGGINIVNSNPISISTPITIKNPNVNKDVNGVGALGGGLPGLAKKKGPLDVLLPLPLHG